jgi:hypothetical protein
MISLGCGADSYKGRCLVCFRRLEWGGYGLASLQNQRLGFGHLRIIDCICAIICTAEFFDREVHCCGGRVQDAFGRAELIVLG